MKKPYRRPELIEYGRVEELTQGTGGNQPDFQFTNWFHISVNSSGNCGSNSFYGVCVSR